MSVFNRLSSTCIALFTMYHVRVHILFNFFLFSYYPYEVFEMWSTLIGLVFLQKPLLSITYWCTSITHSFRLYIFIYWLEQYNTITSLKSPGAVRHGCHPVIISIKKYVNASWPTSSPFPCTHWKKLNETRWKWLLEINLSMRLCLPFIILHLLKWSDLSTYIKFAVKCKNL